MREKIAVAMSGGVDSSVTAALLLEKGYDVVGVTMNLFPDDASAISDAQQVAKTLGIAHEVVNLQEKFQKNVIDYFLKSYANGETPNPCVVCNETMKFGALFDFAKNKLGAKKIATGHYVRLEKFGDAVLLKKANDPNKDQSYVLFRLTQNVLQNFFAPLGEFCKDDVRALAKKFNLNVAEKKDSQEICFVPSDDYKNFLKIHQPDCLRAGKILDETGKIRGDHHGVPLYTIGQRKGLGIAAEKPLYVLKLDVKKNTVLVGDNAQLFKKECFVKNVSFAMKDFAQPFLPASVKIRYHGKESPAKIFYDEQNKTAKIFFDEPMRAVTPGQFAVFYKNDYVIGGGMIVETN